MTARLRTEFPEFSWSYTRDQTLGACARQYYWRYYGSHNGWERRAPAEARAAWRLKHLTTYAMELGSAIHERAAELASAVRDGTRAPTLAELHRRTDNALRALHLRSKSVDQFRDEPKKHAITLQAYYHRPVQRERLVYLRHRLRACIANLVAHTIWDEMRTAAAMRVLELRLFNHTPSFTLDGVLVYAQPDLLFHTPATGWVIVDWKTGFAEATDDQMGVYCLLARSALRDVADVDRFECRVVHLATAQTQVVTVTAADLDRCTADIGNRVAAMRDVLVDVPGNVPGDRSRFPLTTNRRRCQACNFLELCTDELRTATLPPS